jgi:RHS repeat-associated protein
MKFSGIFQSHPLEQSNEYYELGNHLGNVLAVVTDNIHMADDLTTATVASASDYYPFGLQMDSRTVNDGDYRFGFNGKEKDDKGEFGNTHYDYGFRIYNPAIAKFLSVDPLTSSYPWYTPYQFAGDKPIWAIDLDGLEEYKSTSARVLNKLKPAQGVVTLTLNSGAEGGGMPFLGASYEREINFSIDKYGNLALATNTSLFAEAGPFSSKGSILESGEFVMGFDFNLLTFGLNYSYGQNSVFEHAGKSHSGNVDLVFFNIENTKVSGKEGFGIALGVSVGLSLEQKETQTNSLYVMNIQDVEQFHEASNTADVYARENNLKDVSKSYLFKENALKIKISGSQIVNGKSVKTSAVFDTGIKFSQDEKEDTTIFKSTNTKQK